MNAPATSVMANPARSRRAAVGLLVLVVASVIAIVAIPTWYLHNRYDVELQERQSRLERLQRIAAMRPEISRQLEAMRAQDIRRFFLRSGAAALSAAEVQEVIRGVIEQSGGRLITMQALAARDEGRYRQVTVSVQMTANIFAMRKFMHAIETHVPLLFVDNLMVRTQVPGNFKPGPGAEPEMYMSMEVHGYSLVGNP